MSQRGETMIWVAQRATAVVLAIQVWRHVPVAFEERMASGGEDPVAA